MIFTEMPGDCSAYAAAASSGTTTIDFRDVPQRLSARPRMSRFGDFLGISAGDRGNRGSSTNGTARLSGVTPARIRHRFHSVFHNLFANGTSAGSWSTNLPPSSRNRSARSGVDRKRSGSDTSGSAGVHPRARNRITSALSRNAAASASTCPGRATAERSTSRRARKARCRHADEQYRRGRPVALAANSVRHCWQFNSCDFRYGSPACSRHERRARRLREAKSGECDVDISGEGRSLDAPRPPACTGFSGKFGRVTSQRKRQALRIHRFAADYSASWFESTESSPREGVVLPCPPSTP